MVNNQHPIIPPPELVQQWAKGARLPDKLATEAQWQQRFAQQAAQWGADQELEACCYWTAANFGELPGQNLHLYRRPKQLSLKEQAIVALDDANLDSTHYNIILRALEQLND